MTQDVDDLAAASGDFRGDGLTEQTSPGTDLPYPVDWSALSASERRDEFQRLWAWVVELLQIWPVGRDVVPPCWYRHESLIRILSAARDAYTAAYVFGQSGSAAADWMHIWDAAEDRLRRWVSRTGCKSADHRPDRIQRWVEDGAVAAAKEFNAFVAADFSHRAGQELRDVVDV